MSAIIFSVFFTLLGQHFPFFSPDEAPVYLSGQGILTQTAFEQQGDLPLKTDPLSLGPVISAQSALVIDAASGAILYEKNADALRPIASISKLMSVVLFLESGSALSREQEMKEYDDREGGSTFIRPGERSSLGDFLSASLIGSANNATMVLSRQVSSTTPEFVNRMNARARELGMYDTLFVDPTGLDEENVSTARDIVRLLRHAQTFDAIRERSARAEATITVIADNEREEQRRIRNTNELTDSIVEIILGKTGYLDEALYNLALLARAREGSDVFVIILGSRTNEDRFQDAKNLIIWAHETYEWP